MSTKLSLTDTETISAAIEMFSKYETTDLPFGIKMALLSLEVSARKVKLESDTKELLDMDENDKLTDPGRLT